MSLAQQIRLMKRAILQHKQELANMERALANMQEMEHAINTGVLRQRAKEIDEHIERVKRGARKLA